jgi:predicted dehydrogenase
MTVSFYLIKIRRMCLKKTTLIRWGIVSTGAIADKFCSDMKYVTNGTLKAVAARQLEDAKSFAQKHNIEKSYEGYQALFDDPTIDIIYIATPNNYHFQHVKSALEAGKSVLCEKPITISSDECKKLQDLAKDKGLFLMEAMWTYFLPTIIKAKQWVDEGRIGKIKHIKADFGYAVPFEPNGRMYNPELAGGCLFDMGVYPLAIAHYFNSAPLSDVNIKVQFAQTGVDNDLVILANANDVTLSLATSFQCRLQNAALIIGEKGYIKIPDFWRATSCALYKMDKKIDEFKDLSLSNGLCNEAQAVGDMLLNHNKEHPNMPFKTSLLLQQQIELIRSMIKVA